MQKYQFNIILAALADQLDRNDRAFREANEKIEELYGKLDDLALRKRDLEDLDYHKKEHYHLIEENGKLLQELASLRIHSPDLQRVADDYMQTTGQYLVYTVDKPNYGAMNLLGKPDKISMVKGVRSLTKWGLKESKDYVEAWCDKHNVSF